MPSRLIFLPREDERRPPPGDATPGKRLPTALLATPILVIEDEVMIAWMIESLLEEMGFTRIEIASSGPTARAVAASVIPGLVISDINLGGGEDGIDTSAAIRRLGGSQVIFVTAYADDAIRARIEREIPGARVLRKPVQSGILRHAVIEALASGRTH